MYGCRRHGRSSGPSKSRFPSSKAPLHLRDALNHVASSNPCVLGVPGVSDSPYHGPAPLILENGDMTETFTPPSSGPISLFRRSSVADGVDALAAERAKGRHRKIHVSEKTSVRNYNKQHGEGTSRTDDRPGSKPNAQLYLQRPHVEGARPQHTQ